MRPRYFLPWPFALIFVTFPGVLNACATSRFFPSRGVAGATAYEVHVGVTDMPSAKIINGDFLGLSYEKNVLSQRLFRSDNRALIALFNRLGAGVLRIGGNQVDKTNWDAAGPGLVMNQVSPPDLIRLRDFIDATQWKVIYGINLGKNDPQTAAEEARIATSVLGNRLVGFEIGNEPNLYSSNGFRASAYGYPDFKAEWETYFFAIRAKVPGAIFVGPATAGINRASLYTVPFAQDEAAKISFLTQHYYRADGKAPTSTMDLLLTPDPQLGPALDAIAAANAWANIATGYRMGECNSFYNGGAPGKSNGFGTALWTLDFLFANLKAGSSGINFHGGGSGPGYTPIADDPSTGAIVGVRPVYYGMAIFAQLLGGRLMNAQATEATSGDGAHPADGDVIVTNINSSQFTSYAVHAADGTYQVLLLNKDRLQAASVLVDLPTTIAAFQTTTLTAESLDSVDGYTLGGAAIGIDGSWSPASAQPLIGSGNWVHVKVPPGSVILVQAK